MGRRIDVLAVIEGIIFIFEFKAGATEFQAADWDQAYDYGLDLKNFHEGSHLCPVVPILVATEAPDRLVTLIEHARISGLYETVCTNASQLSCCIHQL
ncbi:MAG TPA: hypothetical protein PKD55_23065, partial [Bellilinea sp.]|nr:hypothetical protein [Bellilinea sp.]